MPSSHWTRLAVALLAMLFLASTAVPAPAAEAEPAIVPVFRFQASNGYSAFGWAAPAHSGDPAQLLLIFGRRHASVTYLAPAEIDDRDGFAVRADLGSLGEIDLDFVANGKVAHARSGCGGEGLTYSAGRYEGTIDFKGEEGYTRVATHQASLVPRFFNVICPGTGYGWATPGPGGQLVARSGGRSTTFKAVEKTPRARSYFSARINEKRGRISISRRVSATGPWADFVFPRRGQRAHVSPPAPFSGSAGLRRGGGWRGSLSVDFPGHSDVSLTGPGVRAHLLHARFSGSVARGLE